MTNIVPKINPNNILFCGQDLVQQNEVFKFSEEWNNSEDFILVKSSGSTGIPKEIKLLKKHCLHSAKMTGIFFNFQKNDRLVLSLSPQTIGGKMQVVRAMLWDMKLLVTDPIRNPLTQLDSPAALISLVPLQVEEIMKTNPDKLNLFTSILIGGAPISESLERSIIDSKHAFYQSFGMTETISHIAIRRISGTENTSYFETLKGVELSIEDECLKIHAPMLGIEHLQTNDMVRLIDHRHFEWLGRRDFVINSGGFKFHPEQLERQLSPFLHHPFFIIGESNATYGEIVTLYIETAYTETLKKSIDSLCVKHLERYQVPKRIYFVTHFEKTTSGKINRLKTQIQALESQN